MLSGSDTPPYRWIQFSARTLPIDAKKNGYLGDRVYLHRAHMLDINISHGMERSKINK